MTAISLFPPVPLRSSGQATYSEDTENFLSHYPTFVDEINAFATSVNGSWIGNSTTSTSIGAGDKSLTIETGLGFYAGMPILISYDGSNYMIGTVKSYNTSTGAFVGNITQPQGSGTYAVWKVVAIPSFSQVTSPTTKNKLINAQGLVNQRVYVSGTATTTNEYTLDRWRVVVSGQNLTFSTLQNVVTFTAPAGGVEQVIEGLNIETGTYTLSWTGTATATVNGTSIANGGTISLTGGSNATVRFSNGTFSLPQLEKGEIKTSFDYRDIQSETARCQRYYLKISATSIAASAYLVSAAGNILFWTFSTPVQMRATPTIDSSTLTYSALNCNGNPLFTAQSNLTITAVVGSVGTGNTFFNGLTGSLILTAEL